MTALRLASRALTVASWFVVAYVGWLFVTIPHYNDAGPHFLAGVVEPYAIHLKTQVGAYIYSPAFTQALEPLRWIGVTPEAWYALSVASILVVLAWVSGPFLIPVLFLALPELQYGNVNALMLAAVLLSFRFPWTWAFVLLTKVTPGVGVLWFAFRREWRQFRIALWATLLVVAVSIALSPGLWAQWVHVLLDNARTPMPAAYIPVPLWLRLGLAVALLGWAAPRNHRWAVVVAFVLGTPWLHPNHLLFLVGLLPWVRRIDVQRLVPKVRSHRSSADTARSTLRPASPGT